ncbi:uncharacterized protein LTR77_005345 [Saxophila tyrrhenica]|uniref:Uncharacterized protein n=1 Tax=Saxophila tyrrhenica TaxID=1690608 RepID=A0AAV9PCD4_9PEZI|nr:hypothetical protein LTR77_005345 [Saxophila tyrrhenica]
MADHTEEHQCSPDRVTGQNLSQVLVHADPGVCGFSWPLTKSLPDFSDCCTNSIKTSEGCFRYCEPADVQGFHGCVAQTFHKSNTTITYIPYTVCTETTNYVGMNASTNATGSESGSAMLSSDGGLMGIFGLCAIALLVFR